MFVDTTGVRACLGELSMCRTCARPLHLLKPATRQNLITTDLAMNSGQEYLGFAHLEEPPG
jgi:hypothetical protein